MKRKLTIALICVAVMSMTACGKKTDDVAGTETAISTEESTENVGLATEVIAKDETDVTETETASETTNEKEQDTAKTPTNKEKTGADTNSGKTKTGGNTSSNTGNSGNSTTANTTPAPAPSQPTPTPQPAHTHNWMPHWATRIVKDAYDEQVTKTIVEGEEHWFDNADPTRDLTVEYRNDTTKGDMEFGPWLRWNGITGCHNDVVPVEKTVTVTEHHDAVTEQYIDYYFCADDSCNATKVP